MQWLCFVTIKEESAPAVTTGTALVGKPNCWPGATLGHHRHCQGPGKPGLLLSGGWISTLILPVASEGMRSAPREGPDGHRTIHGEDKNGLRNYLCCRQTTAFPAPENHNNLLLLTDHSIPCSQKTTASPAPQKPAFPAPDRPQHPLL